MKRSFGGGRGMGGGTGGGGGGHMLRTVQRAVRAGVSGGATQEPFSHSTTNTNTSTTKPIYKPNTSNNTLSLSSSTFNLPISANYTGPTRQSCSSPTYSTADEFDWECVDGYEDDRGHGFCDEFVFGTVPSKDEVHHAVTALQQVLNPTSFSRITKDRVAYGSDEDVADQVSSPSGTLRRISSVGSNIDWIEPSMHLCNPRILQPHGSERVYDAFHLLQTEPSIQRMVISLSSDKAVWDAVLNNEVVRDLRETINEADNNVPENSDEGPNGSNAATEILNWIFVNAKAKVTELINKITKLVNELFQPPDGGKTAADPFDEKLRTSFLLSVVVLLIVLVTRAHQA